MPPPITSTVRVVTLTREDFARADKRPDGARLSRRAEAAKPPQPMRFRMRLPGGTDVELFGIAVLCSLVHLLPQNLGPAGYTASRREILGITKDSDAFMTLSFLALPVIPHLKLTSLGLFDVDAFKFVDSDI